MLASWEQFVPKGKECGDEIGMSPLLVTEGAVYPPGVQVLGLPPEGGSLSLPCLSGFYSFNPLQIDSCFRPQNSALLHIFLWLLSCLSSCDRISVVLFVK